MVQKSVCVILLLLGLLQAQEVEPRAYANLPTRLNVLALAYSWSHGNIINDASLPIEDFKVTGHTPAAIYMRTFNLFGKLGKIQALLPFTHLAGSVTIAGKDTSGTKTGLADARLRLGVNLIGSPALAPKDFRRFKQGTILGASIVVGIPTGQYDANKRVNLGANRWGLKPEIGISHRFARWYLEGYAGVWLFTDNTEFLGSSTLKQEPIYSFQWHINYFFKSGAWVALDGVHVDGGRTTVDGVIKNDFQKNWRLGGKFSFPLGRGHSIQAIFHSGVATRIGADFDIVTIAYQYAWF